VALGIYVAFIASSVDEGDTDDADDDAETRKKPHRSLTRSLWVMVAGSFVVRLCAGAALQGDLRGGRHPRQ
jgi:hypothetical protein